MSMASQVNEICNGISITNYLSYRTVHLTPFSPRYLYNNYFSEVCGRDVFLEVNMYAIITVLKIMAVENFSSSYPQEQLCIPMRLLVSLVFMVLTRDSIRLLRVLLHDFSL